MRISTVKAGLVLEPKWQEEIELRDGAIVALRPVRPDDARRLIELHSRLSAESLYFRFLEVHKELTPAQARAFAEVDYQNKMALVATLPAEEDDERVIAVARYGVDPSLGEGVAEVAVIVEDRYQGLGLGTIMLRRLTLYAKEHGVRAFRASIHQSNEKILRFIKRSGLPTQRKLDGSVWEILVELQQFEG